MADKRISTDIKLGALYGADWPNASGLPRPDPTRGPVFVSHEETLRRDLAIINARTQAELGPRPPAGPVQVKPRIDAKGRLLPSLTKPQSEEEETMKISQAIAVAALGMSATLAACGADGMPSTTDATEVAQERQAQSHNNVRISKNAEIDASGQMRIEADGFALHLTAANCGAPFDVITQCGHGTTLSITSHRQKIDQTLRLETVYIDKEQTLYLGPLEESQYHSFILSDVNGDGLADLIIQTGREGAYGGPSFSVYLFDQIASKFKLSEAFSDLTVGASSLFIIENRKLKSWTKSSCCDHFYLTYEIRDGEPTLVERITEKSDGGRIKHTIELLVGGEMRRIDFRNSYDQCAETSTGVTGDILDCIASEFEFQDGRLNSTYRKLLEKLPDAQKKLLIGEQRRWLSKKERECEWNPQTDGQGQLIDAKSCELNLTAARANELQKMIEDSGELTRIGDKK